MIAIFPKITECAKKNDLEKLVCLVRQYFGGKHIYSVKLDVEQIFGSVGIRIDYLPIDYQSALLAKDEQGKFEIAAVINENMRSSPDKKFLLAHLLGHYILHIEPLIAKGELQLRGFKEEVSPICRYGQGGVSGHALSAEDVMENEADDFAAALLMPKSFLKRALAKIEDQIKMAQFFGVPLPVLTRRLNKTGLFEDDAVSFLLAEQKLHSKRGKPPKDGIKNKLMQPSAKIDKPANFEKVNKILATTSYKKCPSVNELEKRKSVLPTAPSLISSNQQYEKGQNVEVMKKPLKGMDRIREIAKRLDSSVE